MKVVHLISGGDVGGAKTHVHTLLRELGKELDVLLVCFTAGEFSAQAQALGINVAVFDGGFFDTFRRLGALIEREGYDIVHCHGSKANMFGALLRRKYRLPVCTTMHSDYKLDYLGRPAKRLTYGTINSVALRKLDYYICVSEHMARLLTDRGFPPQNIFLVCNGLDYNDVHPLKARGEFLRTYGIDPDCTVIGIAARLSPIKDIGTLIAAFAKAADDHPSLRLLIAGDGEERRALEKAAASSGHGDKIVFAGWLDDTDSFYNAIDINALTSLSEGFPYSIVEGARMGCATVASDVGGISMLIKNGVTGCLFRPGDKDRLACLLGELAGDKAMRERLGSALREAGMRSFSLDTMKRTQISIYETILRRSARKAGKRDGVTICGAYGQGNSGDDSILEAVIAQLRSIDCDIPLYILSKDPKDTRRRCKANSVHSFNIIGFLRAMLRSKLYISGGGTLIQDVTSVRSLVYYLANIRLARLCGCRVMMYGCGVGPVTSPFGRRLAKSILNRCVDRITLRDPQSALELKSMGVTRPPVEVAVDPALSLAPAPREDVDSAFITAGIPTDEPFIAFALRPWPGFEEKADCFARAADYAYNVHGLKSVFITIDKNRDTEPSLLVLSRMSSPGRLFSDPGNPALTIGILARMKMLISMRLHALIFAAGQGIPLVGAVYDPKVSSFLDYIGIDLHVPLEKITDEFLQNAVDVCIMRGSGSNYVKALVELEKINTDAARALLGM
jgi:polysaccharide pyruvyl transferase CsaB